MPDQLTSIRPMAEQESKGPALVEVLLPLPLAGAYDYRLPGGMGAPPGAFVVVPLGPREVVGVVWGPASGDVAPSKIKDVIGILDAPPLPSVLRRFVAWVAGYTLAPPGAVLRMVMSAPAALERPAPRLAYGLDPAAPPGVRLTAARRRVLEALGQGPPRSAAELAREAAVGVGVVKALAQAGVLALHTLPAAAPFARPEGEGRGPELSPAQREAAGRLVGKVDSGQFSVTLLDGVTGSGKTEVYFEAMAAALRRDRQALVLLPEIALTNQWMERFHARFGAEPAEWHSDLTQARRRDTWRAVAEGSARIVVGARSALFLPYPALGLIVVDEEHDASYKQDDGVAYHARDMAVVRARLEGIPIVLASATPSLETLANVDEGRYERLSLPDRFGGARLPAIEVVDLRRAAPERQRWLSPPLRSALAETFAQGEQAILFLNRRGYAPLTLCRRCGHRMRCPACTAWLVEHRLAGRLMCHHCGHAVSAPDRCPECGAVESLAACGPGVERLAEEVESLFPGLRYAVMASDTVGGPRQAEELLAQVREHALDLVIGTQIIAKGHHFPLLTLVGIVDADLGLSGGDLRAAERTYQLLHQVSGRAGRAERPGRVLVQTYMPEHPVMAALVSGDRDRFLALEAAERRRHAMPPYGRLAAVIVSGRHEHEVEQVAQALRARAPVREGIAVLGPAPAPLAVLRGRHRRRLLAKAEKAADLHRFLRAWLAGVRVPSGGRVQVDVDPYHFL